MANEQKKRRRRVNASQELAERRAAQEAREKERTRWGEMNAAQRLDFNSFGCQDLRDAGLLVNEMPSCNDKERKAGTHYCTGSMNGNARMPGNGFWWPDYAGHGGARIDLCAPIRDWANVSAGNEAKMLAALEALAVKKLATL